MRRIAELATLANWRMLYKQSSEEAMGMTRERGLGDLLGIRNFETILVDLQ
jgi:hypothetical protein